MENHHAKYAMKRLISNLDQFGNCFFSGSLPLSAIEEIIKCDKNSIWDHKYSDENECYDNCEKFKGQNKNNTRSLWHTKEKEEESKQPQNVPRRRIEKL